MGASPRTTRRDNSAAPGERPGVNVLLIGGGGREHAIAWKLRQSPLLTDLHIAPCNAGTADVGHNVDLPIPKTGSPPDVVGPYLEAVTKLAADLKVDLV